MKIGRSRGLSPAIRRLALVLRFVVSALLIAWLVATIDVRSVLRLLGAVRAPWLAGAVLSVLATHGVHCLRWRWCLLDEGRRVSFRAIVFSYWTSLFVGVVLPTEYGGDLLRIKDMRERLGGGTIAIASVVWSRLSGIGATVLIFSLVGLVRLERLIDLSIVWVWAISVVVCVALALTIFIRPEATLALLERWPLIPARLRSGAVRVLGKAQALATHSRYGTRIAALALVAQVLMILTNWLYVSALSQSVSAFDLALVVPLVTLSSLLPISIGGIGVKDGALVVCLSALGISREGAFSIALLKRLVFLALVLIGGCLFPFRRRLLGR